MKQFLVNETLLSCFADSLLIEFLSCLPRFKNIFDRQSRRQTNGRSVLFLFLRNIFDSSHCQSRWPIRRTDVGRTNIKKTKIRETNVGEMNVGEMNVRETNIGKKRTSKRRMSTRRMLERWTSENEHRKEACKKKVRRKRSCREAAHQKHTHRKRIGKKHFGRSTSLKRFIKSHWPSQSFSLWRTPYIIRGPQKNVTPWAIIFRQLAWFSIIFYKNFFHKNILAKNLAKN